MENIFEAVEKDNMEKEQENLKIENFKPLSNNILENSKMIKKSYVIFEKRTPLKKSASSIFPSFESKNNFNNDIVKNNNDFNSTNKTNSINITSLFNKDINFTTLNEHSFNSFEKNITNNKYETIDSNNRYSLLNKNNSEQKLLSKNFKNMIKTNDFSLNIGKYDKKIILNLSQKCKELENKYLQALKYYYQMENIYINEEKKKKDSETKLSNSTAELNLLKSNYERMRLDNIHLNNALVNARNEVDRLNISIRNDQKDMLKKQEELNKNLKLEENRRFRLRNIIRINERQMAILQEQINDNSLSPAMKLKKYRKMKLKEEGVSEDEERKKDEEILRLKAFISDLKKQESELQKDLKEGIKKKRELLGEIKNKRKQHKYNDDNLNLLFNTIDQQEKDALFNYNLIKSKNIIIKNMKDRIAGRNNDPHYSLPKNIRINSAQKISQKYII